MKYLTSEFYRMELDHVQLWWVVLFTNQPIVRIYKEPLRIIYLVVSQVLPMLHLDLTSHRFPYKLDLLMSLSTIPSPVQSPHHAPYASEFFHDRLCPDTRLPPCAQVILSSRTPICAVQRVYPVPLHFAVCSDKTYGAS